MTADRPKATPIKGLQVIVFYVMDLERSRHFYEDLLHLEPLSDYEALRALLQEYDLGGIEPPPAPVEGTVADQEAGQGRLGDRNLARREGR